MVIGSNKLARRFSEYITQDRFCLFCDGVHDSLEKEVLKFQEEARILAKIIDQNRTKIVVYFSTISLLSHENKDSEYAKHKLEMEALIAAKASEYLIVRTSTVVGGFDSPSSLLHFLCHSIADGKQIHLYKNATRNLIDVDDFFILVNHILQRDLIRNSIITIANPESYSISTIVNHIEHFLNIKKLPTPQIQWIDQGLPTEIPLDPVITNIIKHYNIPFDSTYLDRTLNKYFGYLIGKKKRLLSIVVPTYYEEHGIHEFHTRTKAVLNSISDRFDYEIIFVNDGSKDRTIEKLLELVLEDDKVRVIDFSRNFGNQIAITAGLDRAQGDAVIIIDDDLQDPPEVILNFLARWDHGYKVVYGVRNKRKGVSLAFKVFAKIYYRFIDKLSDIKIPVDTGDFRLIDRVVVDHLCQIGEENRYFRGLVSWVGFKQVGWQYDRDQRYAGGTTFTLSRYVKFAFTGITGFSEKPLYISNYLGFLITGTGFLFVLSQIIAKIVDPTISIRGWTSIISIILFFGGIQLISIGIVGMYLGKVYKEVKKRPLYIINEEYGFIADKAQASEVIASKKHFEGKTH